MRQDLIEIVSCKCSETNLIFDDDFKKHFYGEYATSPIDFKFENCEKQVIKRLAELLRLPEVMNSGFLHNCGQSKPKGTWYFHQKKMKLTENVHFSVPPGADNLFSKLAKIGEKNSKTVKHGYRYPNDVKRLSVYNRIIGGPLSYKTLQSNSFGLIGL